MELFYDLVFTYSISQLNNLIRDVHGGFFEIEALFCFLCGLLVYVNSWSAQTLFTNHFKQGSNRDVGFLYLDMICLLTSSAALSLDWAQSFDWVFLPMAILSFLLALQYGLTKTASLSAGQKRFIHHSCTLLLVRGILLLIAVITPLPYAIYLLCLSILVSLLLPPLLFSFSSRRSSQPLPPVRSSHLLGRLSTLTVILFGQMLIEIAGFFQPGQFGINSLIRFLIIAALFRIYALENSRFLDPSRIGPSGYGIIYDHYLILFGLSLASAPLSFSSGTPFHPVVSLCLLYGGLFLFLAGVILSARFNKDCFRIPFYAPFAAAGLLAAGALCTLIASLSPWNFEPLIALLVLFTMVCWINFFEQIGQKCETQKKHSPSTPDETVSSDRTHR